MRKLTTVVVLLATWVLLTSNAFSQEIQNQKISLAFVGDILLAGQAGRIMQTQGTSYPFAKVAPILKESDLAFGNLECALTGNTITRNVPIDGKKLFIFKTPPRFGKALVDGGIDIVSLANNHAMNGGKPGLIETMKTLKELGIIYVGAGSNLQEARSCRILEVKGRKIGFLAYADIGGPAATSQPGIAVLKDTLSQVLEEVKTAKRKVDFLIVSFHWGIEGSTKPSARQKSVAQKVIDVGADIVIGHHPHVLHPVETYKGKTIAYSLGNFVFDNPRPICCKTMILWVDWNPITGNQNIIQMPCYIRSSQPEPVE